MSSSIEESSRFVKRITYIFLGLAAFMVLAGLAMAFEDPAALFLCLFGAVFGGIGYLVNRGFSVPEGKKAVVLSSTGSETGTRRSHSTTFAYVDEDASEEEVEAYRQNWLREQWEAHPDWVAGTIKSITKEGERLRNIIVAAFCGLAVILAVPGYIFGSIFAYFAFAAGLAALALIVATVHRKLNQRKFGVSELVVEPCPATLGEPFQVRLVTNIPLRQEGLTEFEIALRCSRHVESTTHRAGGERRSELKEVVHWQHATSVDAQASAKKVGTLEATASFQPPADAPATTFDSSGPSWRVAATAKVPGLDFMAYFTLPIFEAETVAQIKALQE